MSSSASHAWSTDNPVFAAYVFYSAVLVVKLLLVAPLTVRQRFSKKIFMNPEDRMDKNAKVVLNDPDVERPRRAHLNDLENIPAFWVIGLLYCLTNPSAYLAINLFRAFTFARIAHTFVYAVVPMPQPSRAIAFFVGFGITIYMAVVTMMHFA